MSSSSKDKFRCVMNEGFFQIRMGEDVWRKRVVVCLCFVDIVYVKRGCVFVCVCVCGQRVCQLLHA